jgi:hypothetical protein
MNMGRMTDFATISMLQVPDSPFSKEVPTSQAGKMLKDMIEHRANEESYSVSSAPMYYSYP